ncbi:MAG: crotonase/enoyl-CoA hydratase family protein [Burkholderiaceae bacterium]
MNLKIEHAGPVTTILIDRPQVRNAVDGPTARELVAALRAFESDSTQSVAVLGGTGGSFCAGADLKAFADRVRAPDRANPLESDLSQTAPMGPSRMLLAKPVIAAVDGYAVAGGMELALWCDLRVVDETATFGIFCRRFGVPLIDGGTVRLPRLIGLGRALDLVLTGRSVDAREALEMGLANRVVPAGLALASAQKLAHEIAAFPQVCLRNDRLSVYEQQGLDAWDALGNEFERGLKTLATGESEQGALRFKDGAGRHGKPDADRAA